MQDASISTFQTLEPFPFKPGVANEQQQAKVPLVSPSKFIKGDFKESDYESDYESKNARIPPIWTPTQLGSDRTFKPVKPQVSPAQPAASPFRPKFEPIEKQSTSITDRQMILRPQPQHFFDLKPGSPPEMGYAPPLSAVETSNTMSFAESTSSSQRVVSVQQTTRLISFDQKQQISSRQAPCPPCKIVPKGEAKWLSDSDAETSKTVDVVSVEAEEKRLQRVEEMRKRFGEKSQSLIDLKPGEPPKFDYAPPSRIPPAAASTV